MTCLWREAQWVQGKEEKEEERGGGREGEEIVVGVRNEYKD